MDALFDQILLLCNGNTVQATRLVHECMNLHPGQSAEWYRKKVIAELSPFRPVGAPLPPPPPPNPKLCQPNRPAPSTRPEGIGFSTWNQLLRLSMGNQAAIERLLQTTQVRFPDKSARWVAEKVLYDLERDRR